MDRPLIGPNPDPPHCPTPWAVRTIADNTNNQVVDADGDWVATVLPIPGLAELIARLVNAEADRLAADPDAHPDPAVLALERVHAVVVADAATASEFRTEQDENLAEIGAIVKEALRQVRHG